MAGEHVTMEEGSQLELSSSMWTKDNQKLSSPSGLPEGRLSFRMNNARFYNN